MRSCFPVTLSVLPLRLAIFQSSGPLPAAGAFFCCIRTPTEQSYVMEEQFVPPEATAVHPGWSALMVHGPLDFAPTGVLASIAGPLAEARIGIFALSTFDTDYVLVKEDTLPAAIAVLRAAGHEVRPS
jgi:uncharacterized protein